MASLLRQLSRKNKPAPMVFAEGSAFIDNPRFSKEGRAEFAKFSDENSVKEENDESDSVKAHKSTNSNEDPGKEGFTFNEKAIDFNESDIESNDRSTFVGNPKHLSTLSAMSRDSELSSYDLTRAKPTSNKGKGKADNDSEKTIVPGSKDEVGDKLLDVYPDRNVGETKFPHIGDSQNTLVLQAYYDELRAGISHAIHDENFRYGHFKDKFTPDRSIGSIILDMQLSGEVSKDQFNMLYRFGRGWAKAICESSNWDILGADYITYVGLEYAAEDLMYMFEQEKHDPLPYPLPDHMKYQDPKTIRERFEVAGAYHDKKVGAPIGYVSPKTVVRGAEVGGAPVNGGPTFSEAGPSTNPDASARSTLIELGITKAKVLATLTEYSAATSKDRVLRNAWVEISKIKGELNNKVIDNMSDETLSLIYNYVQSAAAAKNVPMPMGVSLDTTIARLEALQMRTAAAGAVNPCSDLYAPPTPDSDKSSTLSKLKNKLSKKGNGDKGKGKENIGGS